MPGAVPRWSVFVETANNGSTGRLLIAGASGHGKVVGDCASEMARWSSIHFFDDRSPDLKTVASWSVSGPIAVLAEAALPNDEVFVAIGSSTTRLALLRKFKAAGLKLATIVHPRAFVSSGAAIGPGTVVVAGAIVNIGSRLGVGCIVNTGASVDHDCTLGDGVHICPGSRLAGNVRIGDGSWIGIGSVIRQGISVGNNVTVGAGSAVVSDLWDDQTYVGVPARPLERA